MIVVLADDFSGAAEVAGAAFIRGLSVIVRTDVADTASDVLVIDSATRALSDTCAADKVDEIAHAMAKLKTNWVYKKVDSVLRGPVVAELAAVARVLNRRAALLVSANPKRGRCVRAGQVWVDNQPLHMTEFANDPDYPARSANVLDLLGTTRQGLSLVDPTDSLRSGLNIGNAASTADLTTYAKRVSDDILLAGGVEFFEALLCQRANRLECSTVGSLRTAGTTLMVCGSTANWVQRRLFCLESAVPILELASQTRDLQNTENLETSVAARVVEALSQRGIAMLTIACELKPCYRDEAQVPFLARIVRAIHSRMTVTQLLIEGGSTASEIVRHCGWHALAVVDSFAPGVVGLRSPSSTSPLLVVKPGSYTWPESFWISAAHRATQSTPGN